MPFPSDSQFSAVSLNGQPYFDNSGDESPLSTDLVGSTSFPSFYYAYDGVNVYFRLRVNGDPRNAARTAFANYVWGILFNTDGVSGTYEWVLAVNGKTGRLELIQNTSKQFNTWNDPAEGTNGQGAPNFSQRIINFDIARVSPAGSNFGGNADFFIDFFIPASTLFSYLNIAENTPLQLISFTSTNANNFNKDSLRTNEGFQFINAFSVPDPVIETDVRAELDVTKTLISGPSTVTAGELASYTARITVANPGRSQATTVFVRDLIGLDILSDFTLQNVSSGSAAFDSSSNTLSWNVGNVGPGNSVTLTFSVTGYFTRDGSRTLETATVNGIDSFTGNQIQPVSASTAIIVQATGGIVGTVSDGANGLPLVEVSVQLQQGGDVVAVVTTNENGDYSFTEVPPGDFTVTFMEEDYMTTDQTVSVISGDITRLITVLTPLPGVITGVVTEETGSPVSNAALFLSNTAGTLVEQTITNGNGQYTFSNLGPGSYNLTASAEGFQSVTTGVDIVPNETETTNFSLPLNPASVQGSVTDENGNPLSGVMVEVLNEIGNVIISTTTASTGVYFINQLAPGTYRIRFSTPGFAIKIIGSTLAAGESVTINASLAPNPGVLTGNVIAAGSDAINGAGVSVLNSEGITVAATTTDEAGTYLVDSLPPGNYSVIFAADGFGTKIIGAMIQSDSTTIVDAELARISGTLTGTVSSTNGTVLAGAFVKVFSNNTLVSSTVTDKNGTYTLGNLLPGSYTVVVSADTFATNSVGALIVADEVTVVDAQLQLNPGGIAGTVTSDEGAAISSATVVVRDQGSTVISRTVTDNAGMYNVTGLAPDNYTVTVTADNFQTEITGIIVEADQTAVIDFSLLLNPASIMGAIFNSVTGQPIAGAGVEIRITDINGAVIAVTFTDPNGTYVVNNLAPGTYIVVVMAADFQTNSATVSLNPGEVGNVRLDLSPSPGLISGTIFNDETGEGVQGAIVRVINASGLVVDTVLTDSQGNYNVTGLAPGNYTVTASAEGLQQGVIGAVVQPNLTTPISLRLNETPGSINGMVNPAVFGANVQLYTSNNTFLSSTTADQTGQFRFNSLAPGQYILTAAALNYQTATIGATVLTDQITDVAIQLNPNPSIINGTVTNGSGTPLSNATIKIFDANETIIGIGTTDNNGDYSIGNLPPGTYSVIVTAPNFSSVTSGVSLESGQTVNDLNFQLLPNPGGITGQVTDTNGRPISGSVVLIRTSDGAFITSVVTSPFGNYLVRDLAPGSYTVVASATTFSTESIGVIVSSDETMAADLTLSRTVGDIAGSVVDEDGNPLTVNNIEVKLFNGAGILLQTFLAGPEGTFSVADLAPGRYLLNVTAPGFTANTVPIDVLAAETASVAISLNPASATLTGNVFNENSGEGIPGAFVTVTTPDGIFISREVTGENGQFTFAGLPPRVLVVSTTAENFGSDTATVILNPEETSVVTLRLSPNPGSLTGLVTDLQTGNAISGSVVLISTETGSQLTNTVSDGFGQFLVEGLNPGSYRAIVSADGFSTQTASFTIRSGIQTVLSFALTPQPGTIQGTIINQQTGQPIGGAAIVARFLSPSGPIIATTLSDAQGIYVIPNLAPNVYTVIATADSFGSGEASVNVPANQTVSADLLLSENPAEVEGTVRSASTGSPLPNTLVRLYNDAGVLLQSIETDANGFYRITGIRSGQYRLVAINPVFQRGELSFTAAPDEVVVMDFTLNPEPGRITGKITDVTTNSPLVGALVLVFGASEIDPIGRAVTDHLGNFLISGLAPGTYTVAALATDYARNSQGSTVESNQVSTTNIALVPNPALISGRVTDFDGNPITTANVKVINTNNVVLGSAAADVNGIYQISNLPAGTFSILVTAPGYANVIGGITLTRGEAVNDVNFMLTSNPGSISGLITSLQDSEPLEGVTVNVLNAIGTTIRSVVTDSGGRYVVTGLSEGSYTVIAGKTGFSSSSVGAIITSGEVTTANLVLSALFGTISGTVVDEEGNLIIGEDIAIRLVDENGAVMQTILADSNGTFTFSFLQQGRYVLSVTAQGFQAAVVPVLVTAGETTNVPVQLQRGIGSVSGIVVNTSTNVGIEGALVTAKDLNGNTLATETTDQSGNFVISNLPPGTLNITGSRTGFGSDSKAVIIESGEVSLTTLSLTVNPGTLQGMVVNQRTGNPIAGATVKVTDFTSAVVATVLTESSGNYALFTLSPGQYQVTAAAPNFSTQIASADLDPNEIVVDDFFLEPDPGRLSGVVSNGITGEAVVNALVEVRTLGPAGPVIATAITDQSGNYVVNSLPPGVYTVVATREGFGTAEASDEVNSNQTTLQDLVLFPGSSNVQGRVTSSEGDPLPDTLIRLVNGVGAPVKEVQTDIDGSYLISQFDAGSYSIIALNPNYESQLREFTVDPDETAAVDFVLEGNPGTIVGTVTDAITGEALTGSVVIASEQEDRPIATVITDETGSYTIFGLEPGTYTVRASALRYATSAQQVIVLAGSTSEANFALERNPAQIFGTVTNAQGIPLINAGISVFDADGNIVGRGLTGPNGNYVIGNLPFGPRTITVTAAEPGYIPESITTTLSPGEEQRIDFVLRRSLGNLAGLVTNGLTDDPIPNATIEVRQFGPGGTIVFETTTDENGRYTVSGLTPSVYTVVVSKEGFGPADASQQVAGGETSIQDFILFPSQSGIEGSVTSVSTGDPIPNTLIQVINAGGTLVDTVHTDESGLYTVDSLDPGTYQVVAFNPEFQNESREVTLSPGLIQTVDFVLEENPGTLTGTVLDEISGDPIAQADVVIYDLSNEPLLSTTTDENGIYEVSGLAPGSYTVKAAAFGFAANSQSVTIRSNTTTTANFQLARNPAQITGIVRTEEGTPIRNASITVVSQDGQIASLVTSMASGDIVGRGVTDLNGEYFIGNLPAGTFIVVASAPGFTTETKMISLVPDDRETIDFTVAFLLGSFAGTVTNAQTGELVSNALVQVRQLSPSGPIVASVETDADGRYLVSGLRPGVYTITVGAPGFGSEAASAQAVSNETTEQNFALFPNPATVQGQVTSNNSGQPVPDVLIRVIDENGAVIARTTTGAEGRYRIQGLRAGSYSITAFNPSFSSEVEPFSVEAGETVTINFTLTDNPGSINGTVTDEVNGNPIAGAVVVLFDQQTRPIVTTVTEADGTYNIRGVTPGDYTVRASAFSFATGSQTVFIAADSEVTVDFQLPRNPARLRGQILSNEGTPISNGSVTVFDDSGNIIGRGVTDENGFYIIGSLPPGTFMATASAPGYLPETSTILLIPGEEETANFTLAVISQPGTIIGRVINEITMEPVSEATVTLKTTRGHIIEIVSTSEQGEFVFTNLAPGEYILIASAPNYVSKATAVNLESDETARVTIALEKTRQPEPSTTFPVLLEELLTELQSLFGWMVQPSRSEDTNESQENQYLWEIISVNRTTNRDIRIENSEEVRINSRKE